MQPTLFCGTTQRLDWLDRIEGLLCRSLTVLLQPHSTASLSRILAVGINPDALPSLCVRRIPHVTYRHTTRRLSTQGNRTNLIILLPGSKTGSPVANEAGLELDTWARAPRWRVWQAAPPQRHGHPDKPCQKVLCTSINVCRPYVLSSTSSSNHAGKRQYDASMHDRRFIGIEGLSLTEHGRHMCTLAQTKSWHGLPRRASERAPGLFASRAGSWWRPQRRRCATGLVVLLGWCDHPGMPCLPICGQNRR